MTKCLFKLKELLSTLPAREKQIAAFIIGFPEDAVSMSIEDIAARCKTSVSSVFRLCKSAGYSGYKEFSRALSTDIAISRNSLSKYIDIHPGDSTEKIVKSVCINNINAVENTMAINSIEGLDKVIDVIHSAKRVDFYGIGASGNVAMDAHNKFIRINKISMSSADPHSQILCAPTLKKGDAAVLISYSGNTRDILETARIVKQTKATLISITGYSKNPLCELADICIYSASSESLIRSGPMASRIGQLTVIDILYTAVASRDYNSVRKYIDRTMDISSKKHL